MEKILSIIIAVIFGLYAYKKGLFSTWPLVFNILMAIYLGIMLSPFVIEFTGDYIEPLGDFKNITILLTVSVSYFAIAQLLTFVYLTGTFCVSLSPVVEKILSPLIGAAAGFAAVSFCFFCLTVSGISDVPFAGRIVPTRTQAAKSPGVSKACSAICILSIQCDNGNIEKAMKYLCTIPKKSREISPSEPNEPSKNNSNSTPGFNDINSTATVKLPDPCGLSEFNEADLELYYKAAEEDYLNNQDD